MAATLTPAEQAQLRQTIDMFQVIVESTPLDYQSLEILKEAYLKLGMQKEAVDTSKKIAEAYVQLGQLSSAIMEYETILQQFPDDVSVQRALEQIESKTTSFQGAGGDAAGGGDGDAGGLIPGPALESDLDDGKLAMKRLFVDSNKINITDFNRFWNTPASGVPGQVEEPFLQLLHDKGGVTVDESLPLVLTKSRAGFIPIERYDIDLEFVRGFSRDICLKWCVLPFDRMSKSLLVATTNPFNKEAEKELQRATKQRVLWYVATPNELVKMIKKIFR
jgi:tetratricopeptide (TPR) repeat protein